MNRTHRLPIAFTVLSLSCMTGYGTAAEAPGAAPAFLQAADRMVNACLTRAAAEQLPPLSVVVIDASGALVAFKRQDGAMPVTSEAALIKARTAIRTQAPTSVLAPVVAADAATRDMFQILQMTGMPGGVPFSSSKARIAGAVGVSGATPEQDAACAQRAVEAI